MDLEHIWDSFGPEENDLYRDALAGHESALRDEWAAFLYHEAMWDWDIPADYRAGAYDAFIEYMQDTYGIEWDEVYDWEAYREAYDSQ